MLSGRKARPERKPKWIGLTPTPDPAFVRKLREFDPALSVEFDRYTGKFVVYQQGKISGKAVALVISGGENEAGFRQPDERDLMRLKRADLTRDVVRRRFLDTEEGMRAYTRDSLQDARQELREASRDNKYQIKRAYRAMTNDGKAPSPFRHVAHKPKGKVFDKRHAIEGRQS